MKKNTVILTESQLHRVIKESVKRVLREFNDPADEERNGYPEDYDPYDPFDRNREFSGRDGAYARYLKHSEALKNGEYDDKLNDADFIYNIIDDCDGDLYGYGWSLDDEIEDRKSIIDKNYAFHNGRDGYSTEADKWKGTDPNHLQDVKRDIENDNKESVIRNAWWDKHEDDTVNRYPDLFRKDGFYRKKYNDSLDARIRGWDKMLYGTDQADKRPLHRKGSLNREL